MKQKGIATIGTRQCVGETALQFSVWALNGNPASEADVASERKRGAESGYK